MTPIHFLTDEEDGDETRVEVSPDRQAVWLSDEFAEGVDPEWTRARIARHEDDIDDEGYPLPEMIAAARAERVLDAAAHGKRAVDLDVSAVVRDVAWQLRADARAELRYGHPSLSAAERG